MKTGQVVMRGLVAAGMVLAIAGCESPPYREGEALIAAGKTEASLERFEAASKAQPTNARYLATYLLTRDNVINDYLDQAQILLQAGKFDEARKTYEHILVLAPEDTRARAGLEQMARNQRDAALVQQAESAARKGDRDTALEKLHLALAENQQYQPALALQQRLARHTGDSAERALSAAFHRPISLEFRDAPLRQVFEVLSRTSGLNFVFDKDVHTDQKVSVSLRNSTVADVVNTILVTNQLEERVLDGNSVLVYPNTPAKQNDYQPLTVRTFVLSNSQAKDVANTLKTILKTRDIVVDEQRNMIVMRDTPDVLEAAEKLVAVHEMPQPEVMLDVEILEVSHSRLQNLGIQYPSQASLSPLAGSSGNLTLHDLLHLSPATLGATISPLNVNLNATVADVNVLANPRIRTRNNEKATIQVGERVPNVTTTATATGFVAENIQYVDVGLKLDVQPVVTPDNEVTIRISLEVSSILNQIETKSGSIAYELGTRNASTLLRLKDGENQILGGLIQDQDQVSGNRVPGLGDIPGLNRLFGSQSDNTLKSEIVLSITPRIIRPAQRPSLDTAEFDSGTESSIRFKSPVPHESKTYLQGTVVPASDEVTPVLAASTGDAQASADANATSSLSFQGPSSAAPGSTFDVLVNLKPDRPYTSLPLIMQYDPTLLELKEINPGSLVTANELFVSHVDAAKGLAYSMINSKQSKGKEDGGNAVRLTFKALAAGDASIQMQNAMMVTPSGTAGVKPTAPLNVSIKP